MFCFWWEKKIEWELLKIMGIDSAHLNRNLASKQENEMMKHLMKSRQKYCYHFSRNVSGVFKGIPTFLSSAPMECVL